MRKSRVIFAVLLAVLSVCFVTIYGVLWQKTGKVELTETVLTGDPAAVEDLTITMHSTCNRNLYWDTSVTPGKTAETRFRTELSTKYEKPVEFYADFDANLFFNVGTHGLITEFKVDEFGDLYRTVADKTPAGESYAEILNLADYCEIYPVQFNLQYRNENNWKSHYWDIGMARDDEQDPILKELSEYFSFPVKEDTMLKVTIGKNREGQVISSELEPQSSEPFVSSYSAGAAESLYFIVDAHASDGTLMDYSRVPGGRSLYRLPIPQTGEPDLETLEAVLPLEDREIEYLMADGSGRQILLVTKQGDRRELQVLDAESAELVQTLELDGRNPVGLIAEDGFIITKNYLGAEFVEQDALLTLYLPHTDGKWEKQYTVPMAQDFERTDAYGGGWYLAPDKKRLVQLSRVYPPEEIGNRRYNEGCGFIVRMLDDTGWIYAARFDSSLDKARMSEKKYDQPGSYEQLCRVDDQRRDGLEVNW